MELLSPRLLGVVPEGEAYPTRYEILKVMKPVEVTEDLRLADGPANRALLLSQALRGHRLVPVKRVSSFEPRENFPARVMLEITSRCNQSCPMCPSKNINRPRADMPLHQIARILAECADHGLAGLWLYYVGEPLLHPDFERILSLASGMEELGTLWLSTNLRALTQDKTKAIMESRLSFLNVSVNAGTSKTFKALYPRGGWEALKIYIDTLVDMKRAMGKGPVIRLQTIDTGDNAEDVDAFIEEFADKADMLSVNLLEKRYMGSKPPNIIPHPRHCKKIDRNCLVIFSDGDCTVCDADYNAGLLVGNAFTQTVRAVWDSEERKMPFRLNKSDSMGVLPQCAAYGDYDI